MLALLNAYRAANGLTPVQFDATLQAAANWKAADMAKTGNLEHDDTFRSELQRFKDCGYPDSNVSVFENLAAGIQTAQQMFEQFKASAVHNAAMLNPTFTAIGIARAKSPNPGDPYGWTWVMDFGSVVSQPLSGSPG